MDMPDALQIFIDKVSKANYTKIKKPSSRTFGYQPNWREIHVRKTISYVEFSHNPKVSSFRLETFENIREIYHDIGDAYYKSPDRPMDIVSEHVAYYQTGYYFDAAAFFPLLEQLRAKGVVDIDLEGVYYQIDSQRSSHQGMSIQKGQVKGRLRVQLDDGVFAEYELGHTPKEDLRTFDNRADYERAIGDRL